MLYLNDNLSSKPSATLYSGGSPPPRAEAPVTGLQSSHQTLVLVSSLVTGLLKSPKCLRSRFRPPGEAQKDLLETHPSNQSPTSSLRSGLYSLMEEFTLALPLEISDPWRAKKSDKNIPQTGADHCPIFVFTKPQDQVTMTE